MEEREDRSLTGLLIFYILLCAGIWLVLIGGKIVGQVQAAWLDVMIACLTVPWVIIAIASTFLVTLYQFEKVNRWCRRRKVDARIIRQAKAAGVWDKPKALGGRALELYAKRYGIKREPGEKDASLRFRINMVRTQKITGPWNNITMTRWNEESDQNQESDRQNG